MSEGQCNTSVYCITTVDFRGSGQSLAYDLLLMDSMGRTRLDKEVNVGADLVSSSDRGVRSQKPFLKRNF